MADLACRTRPYPTTKGWKLVEEVLIDHIENEIGQILIT